MNVLRTVFLLTLLTLLLVWVGRLVGGQTGMLVALGIGLALNFFNYWFSSKIVLKVYGARKLEPGELPALESDVRELAEFYRALLGVRYRPGDEAPTDGSVDDADWLVLLDDEGRRVLAVNRVAALARPTWPSDELPKQMHQDFALPSVEELARHRQRAEELGATLLMDRTGDAEEPLYVLSDPAGHPFCLLVGTP